jgi:hypothetical protein
MISKGIEMQWKRVSCLHTIHGVGCGGSWFIVVHVDHLMQLWVGASDSNHWIKVMFVCVCFTWILHMLNNSMQRGNAQIMHTLDCRMCKFSHHFRGLWSHHSTCGLSFTESWKLLQGMKLHFKWDEPTNASSLVKVWFYVVKVLTLVHL